MFSKLPGKKLSGLAAVFLMMLGGVAFASGGGNGEVVPKEWLNTDTFRVMNFVVLMTLLFFVLKKPVSEALNGRITQIRDELQSLETEKAEAEKMLATYEDKIALLEEESQKIISQYKKQGEEAKARILKEASESADKMKDQARKSIDQEFANAKRMLQAEIMETALENAEALIKKSIKAADQERLVDEYLEKVVA